MLPQNARPRAHHALVAGLALAMTASPAGAAGVSDVIDAFPRADDDPVDVTLELGWRMASTGGRILREFRCLSHDTIQGGGAELCPDNSRVLDARELDASRRIQVLDLKLQLGIWRYVVLGFDLPIVLFDQTELEGDGAIDGQSSTVDPYNQPSLFSVPHKGAERSGVADPTLRVRFTPQSYVRDSMRPTVAMELGVTLPVSKVKKATNSAVGEGVWAVDLGAALSARPVDWVEPYFRAGGTLRFAGSSSLFEDLGPTQTLVSPGHSMKAAIGLEFLPYEHRRDERAFIIDLGGSVEYRFEGREYTPLFEALGTSSCDPRDPTEPCELTTYDRLEADPENPGQFTRRQTNGITDVEQYAVLGSWLGLRFQPVKYVQIGARFDLGWETPHFLTFADAGKDLDGQNQVEQSNSQGANEFNPVYADALDSLGNRFRSGGMLTVGFQLSLMGKF